MPFNPFANNDDESSFERGAPVTQAAKSVTNAVVSQTKAIVKTATDQGVVDWLYGTNTPSGDADKQVNDAAAKMGQGSQAESLVKASQNLSDQSQLDETRKKLQDTQKLHKQNYYDKYLGEEAQKRLMQQEEQKKQQKEQQEEEEKQKKELENAQMNELPMPRGKSIGRMRMGKPNTQEQPIEVERAKTRAEANRGTIG